MVIYCGWVHYWVYHIIRILPTGPFLVLVKGVLSSDRFCGQVTMKRRCFAWIEKQFAGDVMLRKDQKKWPSQSQECKNTGQFFRMMSCTFLYIFCQPFRPWAEPWGCLRDRVARVRSSWWRLFAQFTMQPAAFRAQEPYVSR